MRKLHDSLVPLSCVVLALACLPAAADDNKDKPALSGTWVKKGGDLRIEFGDDHAMKILPHGDNVQIAIICKYTPAKNGTVNAEITKIEGKAEVVDKVKQHAPVGLKLSFKCVVKGDNATLDDLKGDNIDALKSHLEGEYEKK